MVLCLVACSLHKAGPCIARGGERVWLTHASVGSVSQSTNFVNSNDISFNPVKVSVLMGGKPPKPPGPRCARGLPDVRRR